MALSLRPNRAEDVIVHSDRGTQFTSAEYQRFLDDLNIVCSMSAVGNCGDNAACEDSSECSNASGSTSSDIRVWSSPGPKCFAKPKPFTSCECDVGWKLRSGRSQPL